MKAHHATQPDEKFKVLAATELYTDAGRPMRPLPPEAKPLEELFA